MSCFPLLAVVQPALSLTKDEAVGLLALGLGLPTVDDLGSGVEGQH